MSDKEKESSTTGEFLKSTFDLRAWIDFDRIVSGKNYIASTVKQLFVPSPQHAKESFEDAQKRLHLEEIDLESRAKSLLRLSIMATSLAVFSFIYSMYLIYCNSVHASLFTIVVASLCLSMAFRYHFWYYQIKQKKLGITIKEWFLNGVIGKKNG